MTISTFIKRQLLSLFNFHQQITFIRDKLRDGESQIKLIEETNESQDIEIEQIQEKNDQQDDDISILEALVDFIGDEQEEDTEPMLESEAVTEKVREIDPKIGMGSNFDPKN